MLSDITPVATLPTADMARARGFYERTLGLTPQREGMGGVSYACGDGTVFVYESQYAGTNKATAVTWPVDNVEDEVRTLKSKGVAFEHYDLPELKLQGDVHVAEGADMKVAWFKDPDGNIFSIVNR